MSEWLVCHTRLREGESQPWARHLRPRAGHGGTSTQRRVFQTREPIWSAVRWPFVCMWMTYSTSYQCDRAKHTGPLPPSHAPSPTPGVRLLLPSPLAPIQPPGSPGLWPCGPAPPRCSSLPAGGAPPSQCPALGFCALWECEASHLGNARQHRCARPAWILASDCWAPPRGPPLSPLHLAGHALPPSGRRSLSPLVAVLARGKELPTQCGFGFSRSIWIKGTPRLWSATPVSQECEFPSPQRTTHMCEHITHV